MPVQGRPTAPSFLPPVDHEATVPFSELFNNGFDRATVDATTQLTDRSIFVTQSGRRYRFESIPDPIAGRPSDQTAPSAPDRGPSPAPSLPVSNPTPVQSATYQAPPVTGIAATPGPPVAKSLPAYSTSATWGRSPSNASPQSFSPSGYTSPPRPSSAPATEPKGPVQEMTTMMGHLNVHRFSATPLYGESDGGAQAAETLTDPDMAPRGSPTMSRSHPLHHRPSIPSQYAPPQIPSSSSYAPGCSATGGAPVLWANVDYVNYTQQANYHVQTSRQAATSATGLPSLVGESMPIVSTSPSSSSLSHYRAADPMHSPNSFSPPPLAPVSPEKEFYDNGAHQYLPPPLPPSSSSLSSTIVGQITRQPQHHLYHQPSQQHLSVSPPHHQQMMRPMGRQPSYGTIGGRSMSNGSFTANNNEYEYDTLTPVVVYPSHTAPSMSSDGGSTGRDNVLPGEDVLFDGPVKSAHSLNQPVFQEGILKVFRNTLTNDLRFHCKIGRESETYWMKSTNAQLVPAYAYDQRLTNVVYIRDKESDKGTGYMQASQGNGRPSGIYQFNGPAELFAFQAKLTDHKVVLDIGSVRLVTLNKAGTRETERFSGARLQIWHEAEARKRGGQSDVASFVTAGTALSGPLRERSVVNSSRLMVYLGRLGEYVTLFVTDDLEVKAEGQTIVKIKARKGTSPFSRKGSRWPGVKAKIEKCQGSEPAAFDIHGQVVEEDVEKYDLYKTFELEFENSPSQDNFLRKWDEVIKERRKERHRLHQIQEEMEGAVFTGRQARGVFM
ncbi:hypothetical protein QBC38DRAFT_354457 [Podospora fimiseda]|uniref:Uncharacterized protein n=1 Tax=Podospora fimiseda TaxID=252190 RepID=A0AAN7BZ21_9PEZI|nr:hypothetical protein QBC38DRAFT_354457 [Podospora fimiseda]